MSETPAVTDPVVTPAVSSAPTEPASTAPVEPTTTVTVTPAPAPAPAPAVDLSDTSALLKFVLTKFAEAELQADLSLDDKIKQITEALKAEIRKADVPASIRVAAVDWCDDALPYVIKAVDMVQAEVKKAALAQADKLKEVALAEVKKCCPSFFAKKV